MLREILAAIIFVSIQFTTQHFVGNLDECILSKTCNHTWTPTCGYNENDTNWRLFLDDCDMHEYNCDNSKSYKEVLIQECNGRCTQRDAEHQMPSTLVYSPEPPTTEASKPPEVTITNSRTSLEVTGTTTDKSDTSTIFVAPTSTEITPGEIQTKTAITEDTTQTTRAPETTPDITSTSTIAYLTDTTNSPKITTLRSYITIPNPAVTCHPGNCSMPSTWETTSAGETRDFVQILRERYGDRVKILRDTTHFPKHTNNYYRKSDSFVPSRHRERLRSR